MKHYIQTLKAFFTKHSIKGTPATWILFGIVFLLLVAKTSLFHWFLYHNWFISYELQSAWAFWLPKVGISLFIAGGVLLFRRKYIMVGLLLLLDLWMIANLMYFRANNCLITWDAILIAHNLDGFESSIGFYYNWQATCLWVSTVLYGYLLPFFRPVALRKSYLGVLGLTILCFIIGSSLLIPEKHHERPIAPKDKWKYYIPFYEPLHFRTCWLGSAYYAKQHSIIAYLPMVINTTIVDAILEEEITLTPTEEAQIAALLQPTHSAIYPTRNIIFILVESFESFALEVKDKAGNYLLPNMQKLLMRNDVAYADKITSQVRHGVSADGKMIVNTGLLPLQTGVAAMEYGGNVYPNFAQLYDVGLWVQPTPATAWNQQIMTFSYGYTKMLGGDRIFIPDEETFRWTQPQLDAHADKRVSYFITTINSHSPFNLVPTNPSLAFDEEMPLVLQQYLTCLHTTDSVFGVWYDAWSKTPQAQESVLVITGDHTVFKDAMLHEFASYAQKAGWSIQNKKNYCPLIIQSPDIQESIHISDICYQMDIFPTLLPLIGTEDYFWKGFGVNILDSAARSQRPISEKDAYMLSDKLIRMNYFKQYMP